MEDQSDETISKRDKFVFGASACIFPFVGVGFAISLLIEHKVIDSLYFSHFSGEESYFSFVVVNEQPAIVCCVAAFVYSLAFAFASRWAPSRMHCTYVLKICDSLFFPLMLCALVHLNDFIQVFLASCMYISLQLHLLDAMYSYEEFKPSKSRKASMVIECVSFYVVLLMGFFLNLNLNRPGGTVAQMFSFVVIFYDVYRTYFISFIPGFKINFKWGALAENIMRFIMLVCVFVETV